MLTFLCGLTPSQWRIANQHPAAGEITQQPEGYTRSGLYEGKDNLWLIQYTGNVYRYWNYSDVFDVPLDRKTHEDCIEIAVCALEEAERLRANAQQLLEEAETLVQRAQESFQMAFLGPE